MRNLLILFTILISLVSNAQEINLNVPNITTSGIVTKSAQATNVNISKWQLGEIHLLTVAGNEMINKEDNSALKVYPNPFSSQLHIQLKHNRKEVCNINVLDVTGRVCKTIKDETFLPNQAVELDLNELTSGMYLLSVKPKDLEKQWMVKIQKQ
ncbi:T9SS type A sorting domain-containing protein [Maribellus sp. YY47]|uniref:T9SS type A sorting domain-containing protein n=1 Tax=Maribellus sp. YY47 TaxID=2929486 RepID=UPI002000E4C3|nr:T9SS type A sorting domain-containing protein [Maribellus sp. YY47]MCK3682644.1 T9SS type A sorting domain-containing protein [Maribellus sp. YY47]